MPTKPKSHSQRVADGNGGRRCSDREYREHRRRDPVQAEADRLRASWRWRCVRRQKLRMQPLCEPCLGVGVTELAEDVNHVVPVRVLVERGTPELTFAMENLESTCKSHHQEATWRERRERAGVNARESNESTRRQ